MILKKLSCIIVLLQEIILLLYISPVMGDHFWISIMQQGAWFSDLSGHRKNIGPDDGHTMIVR